MRLGEPRAAAVMEAVNAEPAFKLLYVTHLTSTDNFWLMFYEHKLKVFGREEGWSA